MGTATAFSWFFLASILLANDCCAIALQKEVDRADRLLPSRTIFLLETESVGQVLLGISDLVDKTGLEGSVTTFLKPVAGVRFINAFGSPFDKKIVREAVSWPPQLHGDEASEFRLDDPFFDRIVGTANWKTESKYRHFCRDVLSCPGFFALVQLSDDEYSYVYRIKLDQDQTLARLLERERDRLDGKSVVAPASPIKFHQFVGSGRCWFVHHGYLYGTGNVGSAKMMIERLTSDTRSEDCLAKNRLYQRLQVRAPKSNDNFRLFLDQIGVARYRNSWWGKFFPSDQHLWAPISSSNFDILGMRWDGSILVGEPARITITEAYAIPSSREEFSSNDLPRDYRVPESIPDDATGLTVFGEHRLRRGLNSKIQGRGGSYRPDIAGTFFFRMSGESCEYSGYSWTDQPFVQNSPRDFERMVLSDASLRGTVDSDADYEELKLDDPKLNPNRSSILFDGDNWYFLEATYEVRQELRQKILSKMMPGHRNFDLDFINLKLHESEERMPFFVEAGVLPPETDVRFPYPPWPSEWEAFLGFPPCNMLWRPARLVGPNQAEWSDIPATKDDLLVTDDVKSIDWLTDFLFRLRFNIYRHTLSVRFTNSPVIYCFNYLDRPGGILQTEIRIVLPESNDIPGG